jgi:hypothetical protein
MHLANSFYSFLILFSKPPRIFLLQSNIVLDTSFSPSLRSCLKRDLYAGGLGFRDLYAFNIAMLAKQGWRLIHNLDSLCAQILRARDFPNGNILQARATTGISYTWRSILKGIESIKKGMIW